MITLLLILCGIEGFAIFALLHRIQNTESKNKNTNKKVRTLDSLNNGEKINVTRNTFITVAEVFNNCPSIKKVVLSFKLKNGEEYHEVVQYSSDLFKEFHALNFKEKNTSTNFKQELTDKMNQYLQDEKYEEASILRDTISKLDITKNK